MITFDFVNASPSSTFVAGFLSQGQQTSGAGLASRENVCTSAIVHIMRKDADENILLPKPSDRLLLELAGHQRRPEGWAPATEAARGLQVDVVSI